MQKRIQTKGLLIEGLTIVYMPTLGPNDFYSKISEKKPRFVFWHSRRPVTFQLIIFFSKMDSSKSTFNKRVIFTIHINLQKERFSFKKTCEKHQNFVEVFAIAFWVGTSISLNLDFSNAFRVINSLPRACKMNLDSSSFLMLLSMLL